MLLTAEYPKSAQMNGIYVINAIAVAHKKRLKIDIHIY